MAESSTSLHRPKLLMHLGPVDCLAWKWFKFGQKNISAIWAYVPLLGLQIYRDVMYGVGILSL